MFRPKRSAEQGFTLIELLVVIAIIGILSSIVLASLTGARRKGRDARRIGDVRELRTALELYYADQFRESYAPNLAALVTAGTISVLATDPLGGAYSYDDLAAGNTACTANPPTTRCNVYVLGTTLEDATNNALSSDIDGTVGTVNCADPMYCIQP